MAVTNTVLAASGGAFTTLVLNKIRLFGDETWSFLTTLNGCLTGMVRLACQQCLFYLTGMVRLACQQCLFYLTGMLDWHVNNACFEYRFSSVSNRT